jgi:MoxR-like ATPase
MSNWQDDFNPKAYRLQDGTVSQSSAQKPGQDVRDGSIYVYEEPIKLAVRVALATGRPLLLLGPPGSGKSSLAAYVARCMNWNYFEQVVTSRTRAQDLLWTFDAVRRLRDAHANELYPDLEPYVEPRVLWWAFDPSSAQLRGAKELPGKVKEALPPGTLRSNNHPSVTLIDEIDKADPDVPNDLLVSLGSQRFRVEDLGREVTVQSRVLVFITSNNERSLPAAFLRRCVIHSLDQPSDALLVEIAKAHFPAEVTKKEDVDMFEAVAKKVVKMRDGVRDSAQPPPSTAEFLDAVRACLKFNIQPDDSELWKAISSAILIKKTQETTTTS